MMQRPVRVSPGFTLVELLVVMALLSLMMLALGSALRTTAQTEERVDARLGRTDDLRVASGFLRDILGRISARKTATPGAVGENPFIFAGESHDMQWVGILPARHGAGGRYHFRLSMESVDGRQALVVRFVPWVDDAALPDWGRAEVYAVARDIAGFSIQYEDAGVEPPLWSPQWSSPDRLPDGVMLSIQATSGAWPALAIPMRVVPGSDPNSGGPSFGVRR